MANKPNKNDTNYQTKYQTVIAELERERHEALLSARALGQAIDALRGVAHPAPTPALLAAAAKSQDRTGRKKPYWSPAARKAAAQRMSRYWAKRRAEKRGAQ